MNITRKCACQKFTVAGKIVISRCSNFLKWNRDQKHQKHNKYPKGERGGSAWRSRNVIQFALRIFTQRRLIIYRQSVGLWREAQLFTISSRQFFNGFKIFPVPDHWHASRKKKHSVYSGTRLIRKSSAIHCSAWRKLIFRGRNSLRHFFYFLL